MHSNPNAVETSANDLVLVRLPNGELAWLQPESDADPRYVLTDQYRRDLAMGRLFDRGPTVADVMRGES